MTRKHATMTNGGDICLAFQSEHGGLDCSEAFIDRASGALICNDGTLEGLGAGVADAAIYPSAEIFAGARLLGLDRVAEGYADGAHQGGSAAAAGNRGLGGQRFQNFRTGLCRDIHRIPHFAFFQIHQRWLKSLFHNHN